MIFYAKTHKGHVRRSNEDAYYAPQNGGFFAVVADGMGGHNAGDVASKIVVDTIVNTLSLLAPKDITKGTIIDMLSLANSKVLNDAALHKKRAGMGSTVTVAVFNGPNALIGQVGDSRAYLYSQGVLSQITKDHSYVQMLVDKGTITFEQAQDHPHKNIITRAIGIDPEVDVDVFTVSLNNDDCLLLCSDGLTGAVTDPEMADIINSSIEAATDKLVGLALERGGADNISVVIACMGGDIV